MKSISIVLLNFNAMKSMYAADVSIDKDGESVTVLNHHGRTLTSLIKEISIENMDKNKVSLTLINKKNSRVGKICIEIFERGQMIDK